MSPFKSKYSDRGWNISNMVESDVVRILRLSRKRFIYIKIKSSSLNIATENSIGNFFFKIRTYKKPERKSSYIKE